MAGRIPGCKEQEKTKLLIRMEETFIENLKYAAERLSKVNYLRSTQMGL